MSKATTEIYGPIRKREENSSALVTALRNKD
jgi:hypothetical protein